jgi:hypothetical protein
MAAASGINTLYTLRPARRRAGGGRGTATGLGRAAMLKLILAAVAAVGLTVGLLDVDGVVVSYSTETNKLVVDVAGKERTIEITKDLHVHGVDGKLIKGKDALKDALKKGVKVTLEEKDGEVVEVLIKK